MNTLDLQTSLQALCDWHEEQTVADLPKDQVFHEEAVITLSNAITAIRAHNLSVAQELIDKYGGAKLPKTIWNPERT